jgi:CDP-glucose 4,6-dehydratase
MSPPSVDFWRGRRVLITGHTGFKGSWMVMWLHKLGAEVRALALEPPSTPSAFEVLALGGLIDHRVVDLRNAHAVRENIAGFNPSVVLHLAAQAIVRQSYVDPLETLQTNVMGTAHLLEAVRHCTNVEAIVSVTSDKCYDNREWLYGYREVDALGGRDPYSASKAMQELVTHAWRRSFFEVGERPVTVVSARAGNVLGGGDWAADRLIPDAARAFAKGERVQIRSPHAVRPWQHVLESLRGYLLLAERACADPSVAGAWNFGPETRDVRTVGEVMERFVEAWGDGAAWDDVSDADAGPHEAQLLRLDASKAQTLLGWRPVISLERCLELSADWYRLHAAGANTTALRNLTLAQIDEASGA